MNLKTAKRLRKTAIKLFGDMVTSAGGNISELGDKTYRNLIEDQSKRKFSYVPLTDEHGKIKLDEHGKPLFNVTLVGLGTHRNDEASIRGIYRNLKKEHARLA